MFVLRLLRPQGAWEPPRKPADEPLFPDNPHTVGLLIALLIPLQSLLASSF